MSVYDEHRDGQTEVAEDRLQEFLDDYVEIASGRVEGFTDEFEELSARERIVVALVAQTLTGGGLSRMSSLNPGQISSVTDLPMGKAYPALRWLEQNGIVDNRGGLYTVPEANLSKVRTLVEDER